MRSKLLSIAIVVLGMGLIAHADIIGWECAADGDGAILCVTDWSSGTYDLTIDGNQYAGPGHIEGSFTTDTELDPTVGVMNTIENDTAFAWTGYDMYIYMDKTFTVDSASVADPTNWNTSVTQALGTAGSYFDADGREYAFRATINMTGGDSVPVGDSLSFQYQISFVGSISFEQEMTPVPEPGVAALVVLGGGLAMLRRRRR